jgi:hypothetical protein
VAPEVVRRPGAAEAVDRDQRPERPADAARVEREVYVGEVRVRGEPPATVLAIPRYTSGASNMWSAKRRPSR